MVYYLSISYFSLVSWFILPFYLSLLLIRAFIYDIYFYYLCQIIYIIFLVVYVASRFRCYVYWSLTAQNHDVTFPRTLLSGLSAAAINGKRVLSLVLYCWQRRCTGEFSRWIGKKMFAGKHGEIPRLHARHTEDPFAERILCQLRPPARRESTESKILPRSLAVHHWGIVNASAYGATHICTRRYTDVQNLGESFDVIGSWLLDLGDPIASTGASSSSTTCRVDHQWLMLLLTIDHVCVGDWWRRNVH